MAFKGQPFLNGKTAGGRGPAAKDSHPFISSPYKTQPGEPVFLLESSTLEDLWAVRRCVNSLAKSPRNPVMKKDRDWEGIGPYLYGSVLYEPEDRCFKMWYTIYHDFEYRHHLPGAYLVCYATSEDGYSWQKPELGVFEWRGSKRNNIIELAQDVEGISVIKPPANSGVSHRYMAVYLNSLRPRGIYLAYSDDGIRWRVARQNPIEPTESDTHNSIVYDPVARKWMVHLRPPVYAGPWKRRIAMMESQDLSAWTLPETVLIPDEADPPEFYGMPVFRRGNLFFGLLQIFNRPIGTIDEELTISPDGQHWDRIPPRGLFVQRGEPGEFDHAMVLTANAPVVVRGEMRIYYGGFNGYHYQQVPGQAAIGVGSFPLDRFFEMTTSDREQAGFILTRPILLNGSRLQLNSKANSARGQIKVAALDIAGKEIRGFGFDDCNPVKGDDLKHSVSWSGGKQVADLPEVPIRLKFRLQDAVLYAFYVG